MARLVVYVRPGCPDTWRWRRWVSEHPVDHLEVDIASDAEARARLRAWTGHEPVPTLVIAADDGFEPIREPEPLNGRRIRACDRGTLLCEPNPGQIEPYLARHGIAVA